MTEFQQDYVTSPIRALRGAMGLTLAEMGKRCGISKSQMHEVERTGRASLPVALAIEALSEGRIDAAELNEDVKAARHGIGVTPATPALSPGNIGESSHAAAGGAA